MMISFLQPLQHLWTTRLIGSTFVIVRHRTARTRSCVSWRIESRIRRRTPDLKYVARQTEALSLLARLRQWLEGNVIGLLSQTPLIEVFG
jgi:hypothetical protein